MLKRSRLYFSRIIFPFLFIFISLAALAQDNSPYSRYGLGDLFPSSNITTRGMGGISAGYVDPFGTSVNFDNPASYSQFATIPQQHSKKIQGGRVIFDVGVDLNSRTLVQPNTTNKFTSSDLLFSYMQLGIPITKNWGFSFGLRPLSRVSYNINRTERLTDETTGNFIDSTLTQFKGSGGSFLPSIGTGVAIKNLSLGINMGYMFGKKQITTKRAFIDSVVYNAADYTTQSNFGDLFFSAGAQYKIDLNKKKQTYLRLGVSGNWTQNLNATQDISRQTYTIGSSGEEVQMDSVFSQKGIEGQIVYPASYRAGFVVGNALKGWLFGVDYVVNKWNDYRFFGQADSVQDNWQLNVGGQFTPKPANSYFSHVAYRFGFFTGPDYVKIAQNIPQFGFSVGMALPIKPSRLSPYQYSLVNVALEYAKRGNNNNSLKENIFRLSVGFNLTDLWFSKRKYE